MLISIFNLNILLQLASLLLLLIGVLPIQLAQLKKDEIYAIRILFIVLTLILMAKVALEVGVSFWVILFNPGGQTFLDLVLRTNTIIYLGQLVTVSVYFLIYRIIVEEKISGYKRK